MTLFEDTLFYVGIIGSRRRNTDADLIAVYRAFLDTTMSVPHERIVIVSGGCPQGGDLFAEKIALLIGLPFLAFKSNVQVAGDPENEEHGHMRIHLPDDQLFADVSDRWRKTKQNYARNRLIAEDSRDALIACVAADRKGGTEDTIKHYKRIWRKEPILV